MMRPKPKSDFAKLAGPREHEFTWNGDYCVHCGMSYSRIIASKREHCFSPEAIRAGQVFARSVRK